MFVSRARYDEMKERAEVYRAAMSDWVQRYDTLFAKYDALKLAGANTPAPAPAPLVRTKASAVDEVIGTVAGTNSRLRKQLKDFAAIQRFQGSDEQEITHMLLNWSEDDSGVPE